MIAKCYIELGLKRIDRMYLDAKSQHKALLCSKLALLELCGWIEESMDEIALRHCNRLIRNPARRRYFNDDILQHVHGFSYHKHFKKLLIGIVGLPGVEELESKMDSVKFQAMVGALTSLKPFRDTEAHQYLKNATRRLDAPSVTLGRFYVIYDGLVEIDRVLRKARPVTRF